jgi:hypothetical protein
MSEAIIRLTSLISDNSFNVGTSAVQLSGGPAANWPLTAVSTTFTPYYRRQVVRVTNNSVTATLYLGPSSSVTSSSGFNKTLAPGQTVELIINGNVPLWAIASAASTPVTMEEYQ